MRKKSAVLLLILAVFGVFGINSYAEESFNEKNTISVNVHIGDIENFKVSVAEMAVYNVNDEQVGALKLDINETNADRLMEFEVGKYIAGEEFYLKVLNNVDCIEYNSQFYGIGTRIPLKTYCDYINEEGKLTKGNEFSMTVYPLAHQKIILKHNSKEYKTEYPVKLVNSDCMISLVDVMNIFDLWDNKTSFDDATGRLEITKDDLKVVMTLGSKEASATEAKTLSTAPLRINTLMYIPLRFTMESLGAEVKATNSNGVLNVNAITVKNNFYEKEAFINSQNITSRTGYMIWIDKSDFAVTVFEGSKNNWSVMNSYPCSIGKPSTPTITGQFEYFSKEKRWSYPGYYCGPIMRFYKGYAMHSTLIRYDGTDYDARTGEMISHGCIRMRPADIQYLWDTIPLYTRVYVTE